MVVPGRRIGFLIQPLHIRHQRTDKSISFYDSTAICCQPLLIGTLLHVSDVFDKIKTEFVKERNKTKGQRRRSEIEATLQQGLQLRAERSAAGQFWTFTMSNSKEVSRLRITHLQSA
jgi:hypothetical protein